MFVSSWKIAQIDVDVSIESTTIYIPTSRMALKSKPLNKLSVTLNVLCLHFVYVRAHPSPRHSLARSHSKRIILVKGFFFSIETRDKCYLIVFVKDFFMNENLTHSLFKWSLSDIKIDGRSIMDENKFGAYVPVGLIILK